jgi:hypothetical protein
MLVTQQFRAELKVYEGFANHLYRDIDEARNEATKERFREAAAISKAVAGEAI